MRQQHTVYFQKYNLPSSKAFGHFTVNNQRRYHVGIKQNKEHKVVDFVIMFIHLCFGAKSQVSTCNLLSLCFTMDRATIYKV